MASICKKVVVVVDIRYCCRLTGCSVSHRSNGMIRIWLVGHAPLESYVLHRPSVVTQHNELFVGNMKARNMIKNYVVSSSASCVETNRASTRAIIRTITIIADIPNDNVMRVDPHDSARTGELDSSTGSRLAGNRKIRITDTQVANDIDDAADAEDAGARTTSLNARPQRPAAGIV